MGGSQTVKFVNGFSLKSFLLYSIHTSTHGIPVEQAIVEIGLIESGRLDQPSLSTQLLPNKIPL